MVQIGSIAYGENRKLRVSLNTTFMPRHPHLTLEDFHSDKPWYSDPVTYSLDFNIPNASALIELFKEGLRLLIIAQSNIPKD